MILGFNSNSFNSLISSRNGATSRGNNGPFYGNVGLASSPNQLVRNLQDNLSNIAIED